MSAHALLTLTVVLLRSSHAVHQRGGMSLVACEFQIAKSRVFSPRDSVRAQRQHCAFGATQRLHELFLWVFWFVWRQKRAGSRRGRHVRGSRQAARHQPHTPAQREASAQ